MGHGSVVCPIQTFPGVGIAIRDLIRMFPGISMDRLARVESVDIQRADSLELKRYRYPGEGGGESNSRYRCLAPGVGIAISFECLNIPPEYPRCGVGSRLHSVRRHPEIE